MTDSETLRNLSKGILMHETEIALELEWSLLSAAGSTWLDFKVWLNQRHERWGDDR